MTSEDGRLLASGSRGGRWLTRDPAGYVDGLSLYLYVRGNPMGLVDPFGLEAVTRWEVTRQMPGAVVEVVGMPFKWTWNKLTGSSGTPRLAREMDAGIRQRQELARELSGDPIVSEAADRYYAAHREIQSAMGEAAGAADDIYGSGMVTSAGVGIVAGKIIRKVGGAAAEVAGEGAGKKVPNPNGKRGSQAHQKKVGEVAADIDARELRVVEEKGIKTPGGAKSKRYADVAGVDPETGEIVELHQVGRTNKDGTPVIRERRAIEDIERHGEGEFKGGKNPKVKFHEYKPDPKK